MKIVSTNIGKAKTISYNGKTVTTGIFKYPVEKSLFLEREDVVNDHVIDRMYHGGKDKACYLYSSNHYSYWRKIYPGLKMPWGMFGENLTVEGLYETKINIGDIYKIGGAIIQVTQPRQPCFKLEFRFQDKEIVKKFVKSGYPGVYVRVLQPGAVKTGDTMSMVEKKDSISIYNVHSLLFGNEFNEAIYTALNDTNMAASCKKDLLKKWGKYL